MMFVKRYCVEQSAEGVQLANGANAYDLRQNGNRKVESRRAPSFKPNLINNEVWWSG